MPTLHVTTGTIAKQSTAPSSTLPKNAIANLAQQNYAIASFKPAPNNHWSIALKTPIASVDGSKTYQSWFVYADAVEVFGDDGKIVSIAPKAITLPVPFFAQVARVGEPTMKTQWEQGRTCFTSAMAMCLKYLGADLKGDDDYYFNHVQPNGDSTSWNAQIAAARSLGFTCRQKTDADFIDLRRSLERGKPAVIGILHRGTLDRPTGGHMLCVKGINANDDLLINDSYGSILDSYQQAVENGEGVTYPRQIMQKRWTVDGDRTGWMMVFD